MNRQKDKMLRFQFFSSSWWANLKNSLPNVAASRRSCGHRLQHGLRLLQRCLDALRFRLWCSHLLHLADNVRNFCAHRNDRRRRSWRWGRWSGRLGASRSSSSNSSSSGGGAFALSRINDLGSVPKWARDPLTELSSFQYFLASLFLLCLLKRFSTDCDWLLLIIIISIIISILLLLLIIAKISTS